MGEIEDIRRRLRMSNLEARIELERIMQAGLALQIDSPLTTTEAREDARRQLQASQVQSDRLSSELMALCPQRSTLIH